MTLENLPLLSDKRVLFQLQEDRPHPRSILTVSVTFGVEVTQLTDSLPLGSLLGLLVLLQECFLSLTVACFRFSENLSNELCVKL